MRCNAATEPMYVSPVYCASANKHWQPCAKCMAIGVSQRRFPGASALQVAQILRRHPLNQEIAQRCHAH